LKTIRDLREIEHLDFRIVDSELNREVNRDEKVIFVVSTLKGRLFTTSESLLQKAKLSGIAYVDALSLGKALAHDVEVGETLAVKIVKLGKEDGQGVGYLEDGSMVVVNHSADLIGSNILAEVESIIPTSGGRMVFGKLLGEDK